MASSRIWCQIISSTFALIFFIYAHAPTIKRFVTNGNQNEEALTPLFNNSLSPETMSKVPTDVALTNATIEEPSQSTAEWKCCIDPNSANVAITNFSSSRTEQHAYNCEQKGLRPSNFSWYFGYPRSPLNTSKWMQRKIYFAGGSTTRQMVDQLYWEMAHIRQNMTIGYDFKDRFLFLHHQIRCCAHDNHMILDMNHLSPPLEAAIASSYDYFVINVGVWWSSNSIGQVIDKAGNWWPIKRGTGEWQVDKNKTSLNTSLVGINPPDLSFSTMIRLAFELITEKMNQNAIIIWRSETKKSGCPAGSGFRSSVASVLEDSDIYTLNISDATCQYSQLDLDDSSQLGSHLCFPSVALRFWLQEFQRLFLL